MLSLIALQLDFAQQAASQNLPGTANLNSADAGFGKLLSGLLSFVMVIAAIMLLIYLVWGGIEWITSGGDKAKTESARNKITQGIIGMIVLGSTLAVFGLVQSFLGLCFLRFGGKC
jgi:hypothetical protein